MSCQVPLAALPSLQSATPATPVQQSQTIRSVGGKTRRWSAINFWLLIILILVLVVGLILIAIFVFVPVSGIKADADDIASTIDSLAPQVNKTSADTETTLNLVNGFVGAAQTDLTKGIFDICNLVIDNPIQPANPIFDGRRDLPTLCDGVPTPLIDIIPTDNGISLTNNVSSNVSANNVAPMNVTIPNMPYHPGYYPDHYRCDCYQDHNCCCY